MASELCHLIVVPQGITKQMQKHAQNSTKIMPNIKIFCNWNCAPSKEVLKEIKKAVALQNTT